METSDIVIHKGEKDEKYQLYVEDYVMSYLKNCKNPEKSKAVFFYGKKESKDKKYYIYGAGCQNRISYFSKYDLLEELSFRYVMDMPVFSIQENGKEYELTGYYIFYQSNEAMQSYMVEQRKKAEKKESGEATFSKRELRNKEFQRNEAYVARAANTEQRINDIKKQKIHEKEIQESKSQENKRPKNGFMAIQLIAVFVVLGAIVINATNSYGKMQELNQAAVEVFFAMENEDVAEEKNAVEEDGYTTEEEYVGGSESVHTESETADTAVRMDGTTLYLTELDEQLAEENAEARQDEAESEKTETEKAETEATPVMDEASPSEQAFARDFAKYYQIEKGDTLYTICQKMYGNTSKVEEICELNQITDPDNIKYGQKILLP